MLERQTKRWEDHRLTHIGRQKARTSTFWTTDQKLSLNGEWKFLYLEAPEFSPDDFYTAGKDTQGWDTITVPSCWQTKGYGRMHYTDVLYLFPIQPPFVPTKNPTGIYKREFTLPPDLKAGRTILKFHGVDSAFDVWVNGLHAGYSKVSRLPSEFDITDRLKNGSNDITVRVYQWSDGTYLEDQDMWWLSGIFRDVELIQRPDVRISDCRIRAGLTEDYQSGTFLAHITISENRDDMILSYKILDNDCTILKGELTAQTNLTIDTTVSGICPWTAETPKLYEVILSLKQGDQIVEECAYRTGFRKIEIIDHNFCVNGKVILLNGVNHHDYDPCGGRTVSREVIQQDIIMMKQHNINAVRCSHYPAMEYFYDLCDEYGLYVIDEADLECHGFEWTGRYDYLSDDPGWKEAYLDRLGRMIARDFNHPSIIMWSLGNESSFGCNFRAAAEYARKTDPGRLVHYEGDDQAEVTDVYSTMYTRIIPLTAIAEGSGQNQKPHVMCEYGHAMGNGPGGLKEHQEMFRKYKRLQGGFIWEWYDHGILAKDEAGGTYYAYGGNFQDSPNNSNFCIDGLLMPDRTPSPGLLEYKQVISPVSMESTEESGVSFTITNHYDFSNLDHIRLHWSVGYEDSVIQEGIIRHISCEPGEQTQVRIPWEDFCPLPNTEYFLTIRFLLDMDTAYAGAGHELSHAQFKLPVYLQNVTSHAAGKGITKREKDHLLILETGSYVYTFHKIYGELMSVEYNGINYIKKGPKCIIDRALIDNDMYKKKDWYEKYFIHLSSEQTEFFDTKIREHEAEISIQKYFGCLNQAWGLRLLYTYLIYDDGCFTIRLMAKAVQNAKILPPMLPRLGMEWVLDESLKKVSWMGRGFGENYADSLEASLVGLYHADVAKMHTDYVYPQENGHREEVRYLSLGDGSTELLIQSAHPIGINVHDYTIESLQNASHPMEIKKADAVIVQLDAMHSGLGSNSCGEEQLPRYQTTLKDFTMNFSCRFIKAGTLKEEAKIKYRE